MVCKILSQYTANDDITKYYIIDGKVISEGRAGVHNIVIVHTHVFRDM